MEELLTIKAIAQKLGLAESTCRYFRDKWPEFMPTVQHGRRKLYRPEALQVIKIIAEETQKRRSAEEIAERLTALFAVNIEGQRSNAEENAAEQQQGNYSLMVYERRISEIQLHNADLRSEIEFLRDELIYKDAVLMKMQKQLDRALLPWWRKLL